MSISEIGAEIELKFMVIKGKRKGDGKQELGINIDTLLYVIDNQQGLIR